MMSDKYELTEVEKDMIDKDVNPENIDDFLVIFKKDHFFIVDKEKTYRHSEVTRVAMCVHLFLFLGKKLIDFSPNYCTYSSETIRGLLNLELPSIPSKENPYIIITKNEIIKIVNDPTQMKKIRECMAINKQFADYKFSITSHIEKFFIELFNIGRVFCQWREDKSNDKI